MREGWERCLAPHQSMFLRERERCGDVKVG